MDRQTALRQQLSSHVHALAGVLRLSHGDPREVWRLADAVLDTHDASGHEQQELRAEVVWVMRQVAARRPFDTEAAADRLLGGAAPVSAAPRGAGRPREAACCG